jgi:hypothetical protein
MECKNKPDTTKQPQVFLSYATADTKIANQIEKKLVERGFGVWFDAYELQPGDSIADAIKEAISATDYLVVLLSPNSVNSRWMQNELSSVLGYDLAQRNITLLPVLIEDCEIPPLLASYQYLDLRADLEGGINRLVEQLDLIPELDFSKLELKGFESLVVDLLTELGFKFIEFGRFTHDSGIDFTADYASLDPFGVNVIETWLIELKFYKQSRADFRSIRQLVSYLSRLSIRSKGVLITNSQLTSVTQDWLKSAETKNRIEIRVIDGTELKRLLLQRQDLVNKYFV